MEMLGAYHFIHFASLFYVTPYVTLPFHIAGKFI